MPKQITQTVYRFEELADNIQVEVMVKYRNNNPLEVYEFDGVIDDFARVCGCLGIELAMDEVRTVGGGKRRFPTVYWGAHDTLAFRGVITFNGGCLDKIRAYAPADRELLSIAEEFDKLSAVSKTAGQVGLVWAYSDERRPSAACPKVASFLTRLARWGLERINQQFDWLVSDKCCSEALSLLDKWYTADGKEVDCAE